MLEHPCGKHPECKIEGYCYGCELLEYFNENWIDEWMENDGFIDELEKE